MIIGLNEALKLLQKEGLDQVFRRHSLLAHATREAVKEIGLKIFPKGTPSNAVTAIEAPPGIDGQVIYKTLREKYGVTAAGGQDKLKGKIFRFAHLGYADKFDVIVGISALEMTLKDLGYSIVLGKGVGKAEEIFSKEDTL